MLISRSERICIKMVDIPKEFEDSRFKRLFLLAEINKFTDEEKKQYKESLKNMGDYNNIINTEAEEIKSLLSR